MLTIAILAAAFVLLFLLAFLSKRRFGILGLGLTAGALLAEYWTNGASSLLQAQGISVTTPPLTSLVAIVLTLLPVILLLLGGPGYHNKKQQFIGALLFGAMAFLILFPVLKNMFVIEPMMQPAVDLISSYAMSVLAGLIAYAVIDTMLAHGKKSSKKKEH